MSNTEIYAAKIARKERRLTIRGVDYCINEWGNCESPLLVYLHGWADTGSTLQLVVDALARDWFVIAPDWRGFGRTPCQCESYWFPDYLADLHHILQHYSPVDELRLVGHSMGANIASLYAGVCPDRVRAFVNIEGFGLPDSDPADAPQRYREWINASAAEQTFVDYSDFSSLAHRVQKRSPNIADSYAEFVAREWAFEDSAGRVRLRADATHKMPNPVLYRRAESEACWHNAKADVLLVAGQESEFKARFKLTGTQPFARSEAVVIGGAGHMIHFESAPDLAQTIEAFFLKHL